MHDPDSHTWLADVGGVLVLAVTGGAAYWGAIDGFWLAVCLTVGAALLSGRAISISKTGFTFGEDDDDNEG